MANSNPDLRYSAPGHREFNKRLLRQTNSSSMPDVVSGPWMSNEAVTRLPPVRNDFEQSRDPYRGRQLRDVQKTEAQKRGEQGGRSSTMIQREQPKAVLKPPEKIRAAIDNQQFSNRWLLEQRDAAMAQSRSASQSQRAQPEVSPQYKFLER